MKRMTRTAIAVTLLCLFHWGNYSFAQSVLYLKEGFNKSEIDKIRVLTPVDLRQDPEDPGKYNETIQKYVIRFLKMRKYSCIADKNIEKIQGINRDMVRRCFESTDYAEMMESIGPLDSDWIMLLTLDETARKVKLGCEGTAEMTGYLFHMPSQRLVFRYKGSGYMELGVLLCSQVVGEAVQEAAIEIARALPKK